MASSRIGASRCGRLILLLLAFAVAVPARGAELLVFAAASLSDALAEIGAGWERESGDSVEFHFAGSSELALQIEQGAPADLLVSADAAKVDALAAQGRIVAGTRRELLSNRLVVVVAAERGAGVERAGDLASPAIATLALAEPSTVPAGIYAAEYLLRAGLWSRVEDKVVPTANVRAALAAVESGDADAAIVYATDAAISRRVRVAVEIPASAAPRIVYVAAVPDSTRDVAASRRLLDFLASPAATDIFRRFGFLPVTPP